MGPSSPGSEVSEPQEVSRARPERVRKTCTFMTRPGTLRQMAGRCNQEIRERGSVLALFL